MKRSFLKSITIKKEIDTDSDLSYLGSFSETPGKFAVKHSDNPREYKYFNAENIKQAKENYNRIIEFENGSVYSLGITAEAEVHIQHHGYSRVHYIHSAGLWGIESDSGNDYIKEVAEEQIQDLRENLAIFNVNLKNFKKLALEALENL
jgi:hypothetical protein